jgi:hypothetical protein
MAKNEYVSIEFFVASEVHKGFQLTSTKFAFESVQGGGRSLLRDRSKSCSSGKEGGKQSGLHIGILMYTKFDHNANYGTI